MRFLFVLLGGLTGPQLLEGELLGKRRVTLFRGEVRGGKVVCFVIFTKKIKSKIFNGKKKFRPCPINCSFMVFCAHCHIFYQNLALKVIIS